MKFQKNVISYFVIEISLATQGAKYLTAALTQRLHALLSS